MIPFRTFITEIFGQTYKWMWVQQTSLSHYADFYTDDGSKVLLALLRSDDYWEVEFARAGSEEVTGQGDAFKIYATVLDILKTWLKTHKGEKIRFIGNKDGKRGGHAKLYRAMASKMVSSIGYEAVIEDPDDYYDGPGGVIFMLRPKKS